MPEDEAYRFCKYLLTLAFKTPMFYLYVSGTDFRWGKEVTYNIPGKFVGNSRPRCADQTCTCPFLYKKLKNTVYGGLDNCLQGKNSTSLVINLLNTYNAAKFTSFSISKIKIINLNIIQTALWVKVRRVKSLCLLIERVPFTNLRG